MMTNDQVYDLISKNLTKGQEWILENTILLHRSGSHLYGTNTVSSDNDFVGVTIPPFEYWITTENFEQFQLKWPNEQEKTVEVTIFGVKKFLKLLSENNPNIVESLFVNDENMVVKEREWHWIVKEKDKLLSQKALWTFTGFATSQLKKLETKASNKTGRLDLIEKYGFDTKFLSNAFRIVWQAEELFKTSNIVYPLVRRKELMDIREGTTYNKTTGIEPALAELRKSMEDLKPLSEKSNLLYSSDKTILNRLCMDMFKQVYTIW